MCIKFFGLILLNSMFNICETEFTDSLAKRLALDVILYKPGQNVLLSTLALRLPFCKLALYAKGNTKTELLTVLGIANQTMLKRCYADIRDPIRLYKEVDLIFLNKLYMNASNDIKERFIQNSADVFGVEVDRLNFNKPFKAVQDINEWIEDKTYQRIFGFFKDHDLNQSTSMVLVSAAHCKTTWEIAFDVRKTKMMNFRGLNSVTKVPMMTKIDEVQYYHNSKEGFDYITVKLGVWATTITLVIPHTMDGLREFLNKLYNNPNYFTSIRRKMTWKSITLTIPKFKIKTSVDWTEFLKRMGLNHIFNTNSTDLSDIMVKGSKIKHLYLSRAKQKNFIEVDEMGSYRNNAGLDVEAVIPINQPGIRHPDQVIADRPFYFTIDLVPTPDTNYELFSGIYYGPEH